MLYSMEILSAFETSSILICRSSILEGKNALAFRYLITLFQPVGNCGRKYFEEEDYDQPQ